MEDHEILTKRLTDWKPETDIRLQKAFGKFVEEAGELLEKLYDFALLGGVNMTITPLEDELADCAAFIEIIGKTDLPSFDLDSYKIAISKDNAASFNILILNLLRHISKALTIVGRCQIQGFRGRNPETQEVNSKTLLRELSLLRNQIWQFIEDFKLDYPRIEKRMQAKIDSKLPWVLGTATDLLSDIQDT